MSNYILIVVCIALLFCVVYYLHKAVTKDLRNTSFCKKASEDILLLYPHEKRILFGSFNVFIHENGSFNVFYESRLIASWIYRHERIIDLCVDDERLFTVFNYVFENTSK